MGRFVDGDGRFVDPIPQEPLPKWKRFIRDNIGWLMIIVGSTVLVLAQYLGLK